MAYILLLLLTTILSSGHLIGAVCTPGKGTYCQNFIFKPDYKFSRYDFSGARMEGSKLLGTSWQKGEYFNLENATFTRTQWQKAQFAYVSFGGSSINWANFSEATMEHVLFTSRNASHADFSNAVISDSRFSGGANFRDAKFLYTTFERVVFNTVELDRAQAECAIFGSGVEFNSVSVDDLNITGADISSASDSVKISLKANYCATQTGVDSSGRPEIESNPANTDCRYPSGSDVSGLCGGRLAQAVWKTSTATGSSGAHQATGIPGLPMNGHCVANEAKCAAHHRTFTPTKTECLSYKVGQRDLCKYSSTYGTWSTCTVAVPDPCSALTNIADCQINTGGNCVWTN